MGRSSSPVGRRRHSQHRNHRERSRSRSRSRRRDKSRSPRNGLNGRKGTDRDLGDSSHRGRGKTYAGPDLTRGAVWGDPSKEDDLNTKGAGDDVVEPVVKANFGLTGALAKDQNTGNVQNGVVLKWTEPEDAAFPDIKWRLYVFHGSDHADTLHLHRRSAFLLGRDDNVADIRLTNPSCSKQHAVIQFRKRDVNGHRGIFEVTKPYIMDLDSTNKTYLNGVAIEGSRYIELRENDVLRFGDSSKEYVLMVDRI
jgi:smad nuclear-interacting protein 1